MLRTISIVMILAAVAACDKADQSVFAPAGGVTTPVPPLPDESAAGIWGGNFNSDTLGQRIIFGIISATGETQLVDELNGQYAGITTTNGNNFSSDLSEYQPLTVTSKDAVLSGPFDIDGQVNTGISLNGTYSSVNDSGTASLRFDTIYLRPSALDKLDGIWRANIPGRFNLTWTVGPDGQVTGSDTDTCTYTGQISLIDDDFNAYSASINVAAPSPLICGLVVGLYTGLVTLLDEPDTEDTMFVALTRGDRAINVFLDRM